MRNQLTGISRTGLTASFTYDSFGRRTGKTINGTTTNFVYDGLNPVQEKNGATVTANLLTVLGIDEFFTRTEGGTARSLLPDALGSTVALGDSTGTIQTQYTYEPFGFTSQTGTASTNSYKYTGREDDGTGLYYYRARYYQPRFQRFISEDPVGLKAGPNLYLYVGLTPLRFVDPLGLTREDIDAMTNLARINNPDLKVPETVDTMSMAEGGLGFTNPFSLGRGVYVNDKFLLVLDCLQILDLYEIIIHESIHRTRSRWDSIWRPLNHPDIYEEARRRTVLKISDVLEYCEECSAH